MDEKEEGLKQRDREVIRSEGLDDPTLDAILAAEPGKRSRDAGRGWQIPQPGDVLAFSGRGRPTRGWKNG